MMMMTMMMMIVYYTDLQGFSTDLCLTTYLTENPFMSSLISIILVCIIVNCLIPFIFFSDMFLAAGENLKAIEIIGQHGWVEK